MEAIQQEILREFYEIQGKIKVTPPYEEGLELVSKLASQEEIYHLGNSTMILDYNISKNKTSLLFIGNSRAIEESKSFLEEKLKRKLDKI